MMKLDIMSPYPPANTGIGQCGYHVSRALEGSGLFSRISIQAGAQTTAVRNVISSTVTTVDYAWKPDHPETFGSISAGIQRNELDLVWLPIGGGVFSRSPFANLLGLMNLNLVRMCGYLIVVTLHELFELADLKMLKAPGGKLAFWGACLLTHLATNADVVCLTIRFYTDWINHQKPFLPSMRIPIGAYQTLVFLPEQAQPELLFFATHAPYKGLEILLEAYHLLLPIWPSLLKTIAGAEHPGFPGYSQRLKETAISCPVMRFLGQVPVSDIRSLLARWLIVVFPYLASTGSSSVLYQAAIWGRARVASDLTEPRAASEESGLEVNFFRTSDAKALAESIQVLLESPAARVAQTKHNFSVIQSIGPEDTCARYVCAFNLALEIHHISKRLSAPENTTQEAA